MKSLMASIGGQIANISEEALDECFRQFYGLLHHDYTTGVVK